MHYLYKIIDTLNNKVYIGQTIDVQKRWCAHKSYAKNPEKTGQYIHRAMAKHGIQNFVFEVIATCKTQEDTDEVESLLIIQYNSRNKEHGYNLMVGGSHGGHSEKTKQKISELMFARIATKGHPAQGRIATKEQRELLRKIRLENHIEYTEEIRQHMSEAHVGIKDTEETKQKKSESAKVAWTERISYEGIKCHAPDCQIVGKAKYKIIGGVRYCNKHGLRMLRYGRLDRLSS
jgi:group I intron endonuclease